VINLLRNIRHERDSLTKGSLARAVNSTVPGIMQPWASARGTKRALTLPEIGTKIQKCLKNRSQQLKFDYYILFLQWQFICRYDTHTAQKPGSLFWCHALMTLKFTHVRSFACRGRLRNLQADCSTVGFLRNNNLATNLQRFASSYGDRRFAACDC